MFHTFLKKNKQKNKQTNPTRCGYSFKWPRRGDSSEYAQHTVSFIKEHFRKLSFEPRCDKTGFLNMRKQIRRSAVR